MAEVLMLRARLREVGNSQVRRLLPAAKKQAVGPFLFFDHFGPEELEPSSDHDVRPHPHIGLSTVTYLFEGRMVHRDSIGSVQAIEPGAINWMTAGRGIAHSERAPEELKGKRRRSHGLQLWVGLPKSHEDGEPGFAHTPGAAIPQDERDGARIRMLIGRGWDMESPVVPVSETLYVDIALPAGGALDVPALAAERAVYGVDGSYSLQGRSMQPYAMAVLPAGKTVRLEGGGPARVVLIGGEPLDGPRFIWWNFVSSRRERIVEAASEWDAHQTPRIPGESEWIPLPGSPSFLP
jgi:redox-sensitive bicupin YhaK (pirin superfamily)